MEVVLGDWIDGDRSFGWFLFIILRRYGSFPLLEHLCCLFRSSPYDGFMFWLTVGSFWKVHHLNERRKTEEFYSRLEAGEVTVNVEE